MPKLDSVIIPKDVKLSNEVEMCDDGGVSNCTHPAGHCFGSDGGSGIPENMKVEPGKGGEQEVWTLDPSGNTVLKQEIYEKCQFCGKVNYVGTKEEVKG